MSCKEWKEYKIDEVYKVSNGLSKKREEFGFGYEFLTFTDVFNNYFVPKKLDNLVNSSEKEREKCSIKRGDVFLTRTSEKLDELGRSCVALKDYENATFNGFTKRLRPKGNIEILPEYAGYYFRSPKFRNLVTSMSSMTTRASLNNDMLSVLTITVPPVDEQQKIANILSSLDDKIELNNEMNKTLEEMAQSIFKRWFVDFEFPNEDGEPYKSSGGEMVDSELGMIPKGWEVKELGDAVEFKYGKMPKKTEIVDEGYPIFSGYKITGYYKNFMFEEPQLIVVARGVGGTGDVKFSPPKCYLTNLSIAILLSNNYKIREYLYYYLKKSNLKMLDTGSAQSQITIANLSKFKIVNPSNEIIEKFHTFICSIFKSKDDISLENEQLTSIRDSLLPKLMSGEIRLK